MKRCEDHKNETADRTKEMRYLALNTGVAPIFYDDIEPQFFGSKGTDYARRTVLSLAQIATEPDSRVALIIGSTNAEGVTLKDEVQRRVKFLLFTCKFPDEGNDQERPFFKPESKIELKQIASQLNNSLYLDFLYRMSAKFADPNTSFDFETNNAMDYLSFARNIFKDYYRMIDYPLSEYFPSEPVIGDIVKLEKICGMTYTFPKKSSLKKMSLES